MAQKERIELLEEDKEKLDRKLLENLENSSQNEEFEAQRIESENKLNIAQIEIDKLKVQLHQALKASTITSGEGEKLAIRFFFSSSYFFLFNVFFQI